MSQPNYKKWLANILILILAVVLMLAIAEAGMRIIDGYRLNSVELEQNTGE